MQDRTFRGTRGDVVWCMVAAGVFGFLLGVLWRGC
jgi:hypothetical protein